MSPVVTNLAYLVASVLFIYGLKGLTHPRTAVRGNLMGAMGMLIAVVVTLLRGGLSFEWILAGIIVGGLVGGILAVRIQMTAMPQLVGLFNGFGGIASTLVAGAELLHVSMARVGTAAGEAGAGSDLQFTIAVVASGIIGAVTFTGSVVAFGKLQGIVTEKAVLYRGQQVVKILFAVAALAFGVNIIAGFPGVDASYLIMSVLACVLGVLVVIPIGGADMPVVIALLNSYSGLAAAATGFVLSNNVLIIAGSLVGASGFILTAIMCKAMNRSLANVLFGTWGADAAGAAMDADAVYAGRIKRTSAEELAMILDGVRSVVFVPGYGLAVAQAQHAVRDLANLLKARRIDVKYAIHPVAGRMPGHMNVLLAEADVPYDELWEMDAINPMMPQTDVCIVLGANDVVNPVARDDPSSPIAGMPIIDVDKSRTVVVVKRSLSPGFAGIPNPLFAADNTLMFFSDAKEALMEVSAALKEL